MIKTPLNDRLTYYTHVELTESLNTLGTAIELLMGM